MLKPVKSLACIFQPLLVLLAANAMTLEAASPARPAASARLLADPIKVSAIPQPCVWINAAKDFKVLAEDAITITAPAKTDLYNDLVGGSKSGNAPMLVFPPDKNFVMTVKVTVEFEKEFDGGILVLYGDQEHWAKLLFEKSHYGPTSVCSSVTNAVSDGSVHRDIPGKEVFLRIGRMGDLFALYLSLDGQRWNNIRFFSLPFKGDLRLGFAAQSPLGDACKAVFSKISYTPKAPGDFWTGEPGK